MKIELFSWLGEEFVTLSTEGRPQQEADYALEEILSRFDQSLRPLGLSLENAVRTRLWATDRESRDRASDARFKRLAGAARASSSSFIAPERFLSAARAALDMIAMRPPRPGLSKTVVEYDPPKRPCRYVTVGDFVFLTGEEAKESRGPSLVEQWKEIHSLLSATLEHAGTTWNQAVRLSCFLHRSQEPSDLRDLLTRDLKRVPPYVGIVPVDDYALPGGLLEVEVTTQKR